MLDDTLRNYIRVEFPSKNSNISLARAIIAAFASQLDITIEQLSEVKTIVSEIVTNSIIHGYDNQTDDKDVVVVVGKLLDKGIEITVSDNGKGIENIEKAKKPFYTTSKKGRCGMGFTIVSSFCNSIEITSNVNIGTTVKIIKNF